MTQRSQINKERASSYSCYEYCAIDAKTLSQCAVRLRIRCVKEFSKLNARGESCRKFRVKSSQMPVTLYYLCNHIHNKNVILLGISLPRSQKISKKFRSNISFFLCEVSDKFERASVFRSDSYEEGIHFRNTSTSWESHEKLKRTIVPRSARHAVLKKRNHARVTGAPIRSAKSRISHTPGEMPLIRL